MSKVGYSYLRDRSRDRLLRAEPAELPRQVEVEPVPGVLPVSGRGRSHDPAGRPASARSPWRAATPRSSSRHREPQGGALTPGARRRRRVHDGGLAGRGLAVPPERALPDPRGVRLRRRRRDAPRVRGDPHRPASSSSSTVPSCAMGWNQLTPSPTRPSTTSARSPTCTSRRSTTPSPSIPADAGPAAPLLGQLSRAPTCATSR